MRNHSDFEKYLEDWQKYTEKFVRNPYLKNPQLYFDDQSIRAHNHLNSAEFASFLNDDFSIGYNHTESDKSGTSTDAKAESFQVAYTMGGASIRLMEQSVTNQTYGTAATADFDATIVSLGLAF